MDILVEREKKSIVWTYIGLNDCKLTEERPCDSVLRWVNEDVKTLE